MRTKSSFLGRTKSPKDLLDNVPGHCEPEPWPPLEAAEEKRRLGLLLKWHFFQRRNGVTLRSTSIETEDLNGEEEVVDIIHGTVFVMGTARKYKK